MSTVNHTPGPWSVNTDAEYCGMRIDAPNGRSVAHAIQRDAHPVHGQGITQAEAEANGRLISAAPDLILALYETTALLEACGDSNRVTKLARAAIAKARGDA